MPRNYQRKKEPVNKEVLEQCLTMISQGAAISHAAKECGLNFYTVRIHLLARQQGISLLPSPGHPPSIPLQLAEEIAAVVKAAASHGFGLLKTEVSTFVQEVVKSRWNEADSVGQYLRQHCPFKERLPSHDWVEQFMEDHHLTLRKPSNLERYRVTSVSDPFVIYPFYDGLREEMERLNIMDKPGHVLDLDETCFVLDPTGCRIVAEKGERHVPLCTAGTGRMSFSVLACVKADGVALPPLIIFPGM